MNYRACNALVGDIATSPITKPSQTIAPELSTLQLVLKASVCLLRLYAPPAKVDRTNITSFWKATLSWICVFRTRADVDAYRLQEC